MHNFVIPVKTGIQSFQVLSPLWIPAYAGMTDFLRVHLNCFMLNIRLSPYISMRDKPETWLLSRNNGVISINPYSTVWIFIHRHLPSQFLSRLRLHRNSVRPF